MHLPRVLALAAVAATAVAAPPPTPVLRVTAIPEARDDFQKNEAVFTAWLGQRAGVPVELRLAGSYEEAVHLLVTKEADLGWLGGVTTVQVMTQTGGRIHPIVIREKDREFKSYVIGQQDCGAVNYKVFDQMVADKAVDPAKVKVVWTSPTFVDQSWVAARDVDVRLAPGLLEKITAAFLDLDAARPADRRVLDILKTEKYVEAKAEWWRGVAAALSVIKLGTTP